MPSREARFTVNAPPQALWQFIRDFHSLCSCIPGIERIEVRDARTAQLTVKEKIGVVPLVVELRAEIDSEEPPHRLHATAKGEHVTMAIDVSLSRTADGTELVSHFDVRGDGPLKPVVDRLFERRATERTAQFAACLEKHFGAVPAPAVLAPAARTLPWWKRLFRRRASSPPSS